MKRKDFLKLGIGNIIALPAALSSCTKDEVATDDTKFESPTSGSCTLSPSETAGPFPIKSPSSLVRENIIGDRTGVALQIDLTVKDKSESCEPVTDVYVDLWHCDSSGYYSQYGGTNLQASDFTGYNFLRGRQTSDGNGKVSFLSIFPGWYKGRAPHIHIEVLDKNGNSLRVTQIAFPKNICDAVYASSGYNGAADTLNATDNVFSDSIDNNMLDSITGNNTDGYVLKKEIII